MINLKKLFSLATILLQVMTISGKSPFSHDENAYDPVADPQSMVVCGNARFTVLTPQLIRMEYSPDASFEDNKTLMAVNRRLATPGFKKKVNKNGVTITTSDLTLSYKNDGRPFSKSNLSVTFPLNKRKVTWNPESRSDGNLKGTMRTLDGVDGATFDKTKFEPGLLSRDGWAVVDDSSTPLLVPTDSHWEEWVAERPESANIDWYFFGYGHDYKKALADYQKIAGRAALPPKYTFGYWWSRYWQYSDDEFQDLVDKIRSYNIPLDVLIVDMDWHETYGLGTSAQKADEYRQWVGWTGYSWQKQLFPNPANFLKWVKRENLKTALNLHPASGIQPFEDCYDAFVSEYKDVEPGKSSPFMLDNEKWADAYFNQVLTPMEDMGIDFWWTDWQQWLKSKYVNNLSNTFWINHTFYNHARHRSLEDSDRKGLRPFIYHRWGGLGSHRYPLGFSGDTYVTWGTLDFLPYFTSTSSNVNYGYWGHDIGGHMLGEGVNHTDPELYLRWLQYGVFTPIFKTHSTKDNRIVRYPWSFPDHQFMMRDAIKLRYSLAPYIYNAARENYDTGVSMCRPMYYEYPESDKAYESQKQYFFGNDIIATVISQPVDSISGLAETSVWIPEGKWFDMSTGNMYDKSGDVALNYTLEENPWFVKAGAIIPMNPDKVTSLQLPCDTLVLTFVPGADGKLTYYEDDGVSVNYKNDFALTEISKHNADGNIEVKIAPRSGKFQGAPSTRNYELRFPATMPPSKVKVNGKEYPYSRFPEPGTWTYNGLSLQPVVYTESLAVESGNHITLEYDNSCAENPELYGKSKFFKRCRVLTPEFKEEQALNGEGMAMLPEGYLKVSQCPNFIQENPSGILDYLNDFENSINALGDILDSRKIGDKFRTRVKKQLDL